MNKITHVISESPKSPKHRPIRLNLSFRPLISYVGNQYLTLWKNYNYITLISRSSVFYFFDLNHLSSGLEPMIEPVIHLKFPIRYTIVLHPKKTPPFQGPSGWFPLEEFALLETRLRILHKYGFYWFIITFFAHKIFYFAQWLFSRGKG